MELLKNTHYWAQMNKIFFKKQYFQNKNTNKLIY